MIKNLNSRNRSTSRRTAYLCLSIASLCFASLVAQAKHTSPTPTAQTPAKPATAAQDPGERKFVANCSRCHDAPEQFSPRIAGTIVRHMRVRASLSEKDAQDILQFLAP